MLARERCRLKAKASKAKGKVSSPNRDQHATTIGSQAVAHKAIIVRSIIRGVNQAGAQSAALPSMQPLNALAQSSPKPRMRNGMNLHGIVKKKNVLTINGSQKSMRRPKVRRVKEEALGRKASLKGRPQDRLLQDLHSLHRRSLSDPKPNPNLKHAHAWQMTSSLR